MRKFLLIVGVVLILIGLVAAVVTLLMIGFTTRAARAPTIDNTAFCAVLYAAGFGALYLRHRTPTSS